MEPRKIYILQECGVGIPSSVLAASYRIKPLREQLKEHLRENGDYGVYEETPDYWCINGAPGTPPEYELFIDSVPFVADETSAEEVARLLK